VHGGGDGTAAGKKRRSDERPGLYSGCYHTPDWTTGGGPLRNITAMLATPYVDVHVWDDAPLYLACLHGDRPLAELLLRHGASLHAGSGRALRTPLGVQLRDGSWPETQKNTRAPRTFGEVMVAAMNGRY